MYHVKHSNSSTFYLLAFLPLFLFWWTCKEFHQFSSIVVYSLFRVHIQHDISTLHHVVSIPTFSSTRRQFVRPAKNRNYETVSFQNHFNGTCQNCKNDEPISNTVYQNYSTHFQSTNFSFTIPWFIRPAKNRDYKKISKCGPTVLVKTAKPVSNHFKNFNSISNSQIRIPLHGSPMSANGNSKISQSFKLL